MVDNALSPHGGEIVERIMGPEEARQKIRGLRTVPVRAQMAREIVSTAYGFFSPIDGFMGLADVDSVARKMTLASGYVWSIPLVFDMSDDEIKHLELREGDSLLLTFQDQPMATLDVEEIFTYDKEFLARQVYGTADQKHPGVKRTLGYKDRFLGGQITLVNTPVINPPFDRFWYTPKQFRAVFADRGWKTVAAHQTRNVPHTGHEWLMKGAWFAANADAVLVNAVVGEKRPGDYIDEAIILTHDILRTAGYFREDIHMTSMLLWDMRYAGPREAVFHAIVRKNLGCTHHMFGRDHAGVGTYYDTYAAHRIFNELPDLGIKPVKTLEWYYCPDCSGIVYEEQCGHIGREQKFSGSLIRSIIQDGVKPTRLIFRPEVFDVLMDCAEKYGFGTPFVTEYYLQNAKPVITIPPLPSENGR
ncbi:MAG: sulfate adenylyltransferase [Chloroflexi bacterium]|nr:sulfate adenylyltransferase [Chloroflexota bacterium]